MPRPADLADSFSAMTTADERQKILCEAPDRLFLP